ncbi:hypothetical protein Cgig2_014372 [Carnegiea gigantea]|uniref:Tetraspanin n=1 Tax=Carnegiea gigantea TaxID=171969 RepID=A0A9Q1KFI5_9CARY|nr:hypothetical protein Cgig2_014372 [Carnegiea gigantea]
MRGENINGTVGCLNCMALFMSGAIITSGLWMVSNPASTDCDNYCFQSFIIAVGVFLFVAAFAGLGGVCFRLSWLLFLHLLLIFVLIVVLFCFTISIIIATNNAAEEGGYKLAGDGSNWLQKRVIDAKNWMRISSCLNDAKLCQNVAHANRTRNFPHGDGFLGDGDLSLSAFQVGRLQSGCCKPPDSCNGYAWMKNSTTNNHSLIFNPDCDAWSNDPAGVCFNCQSCKAAVLLHLASCWRNLAIDNILFIVCLITIWSFGCCAFYTNWRHTNSPRLQFKLKQGCLFCCSC